MDALHVTTAHTSTDTRIFDKELKTLANAGFDVGLVAHETPLDKPGGLYFFSLGSAGTRTQRWGNIPKAIKITSRIEPSIIHIHDPELFPLSVYLGYKCNSKIILDIHEDYSQKVSAREWIPPSVSPILRKLVPHGEKLAAGNADAVIGATEWITGRFKHQGRPTETIHNFPKTDIIPESIEPIRSSSDCILCYVGGLVEVRGINEMLILLNELLDRGIDAELWALGSWMPDANEKAAKQFIRSNGLESHIKFPGYVEYDEMFRYLCSADVGLCLLDTDHSRHAIPTKLFEYLYAGLPVVATPIDAVNQYLPDQFGYVVPHGNTKAAADVVEATLQEDYDENKMRSLVKEKYSWEHEAEKLIDLYEELLEE